LTVVSAGIKFNSPTGYENDTGGSFVPVQLISEDTVNGSASSVGLDTAVPYAGGTLPSNDNPSLYLPATETSVTREFSANMFLMWKSSQTGAIMVPIGYQNWGFTAAATCSSSCGTYSNWTVNTTQAGPIGDFTTSSSSQTSAGNNVLVDGIPTWTTVSN
jgi:hypothetical protein